MGEEEDWFPLGDYDQAIEAKNAMATALRKVVRVGKQNTQDSEQRRVVLQKIRDFWDWYVVEVEGT